MTLAVLLIPSDIDVFPSPGVMQQAVGLEDLSQETKVYSRMKHNTCMLRSRSLQRRMVLRKDSTDGMDPDQTR